MVTGEEGREQHTRDRGAHEPRPEERTFIELRSGAPKGGGLEVRLAGGVHGQRPQQLEIERGPDVQVGFSEPVIDQVLLETGVIAFTRLGPR